MNNVIKTFFDLVKIDSPSGQEKEMRNFLISWLKKYKFSYKTDSVGNLYAYTKKIDKPLLFCAHMDTVQPGVRIKPVINNGVITSSDNTILGADNKATIAVLLSTLTQLAQSNRLPSLELLFTIKEETGGGIEYFPIKWIRSKLAFTIDSAYPLGGLVLRSPNIINFYVRVIGKAAHSSLPEKGHDALNPLISLLSEIKNGYYDDKETTINIGVIKGGTGINTIPEKIEVAGEIRSYDEKLFKRHVLKIKQLVKKMEEKYKVSVDLKTGGFCPGYHHEKNDKTINAISKIYGFLNLKVINYDRSGISDANILNSKGINTYNLTDGVKNPHTLKESVSGTNLEILSKIVSKIIQSKDKFT